MFAKTHNSSRSMSAPHGTNLLLASALLLAVAGLANAQAYGPDLIVKSISSGVVANPILGQPFDVSVVVKNIGDAWSEPFYLLIHTEQQPSCADGMYETYEYFDDGLAPGEESDPIVVSTIYYSYGAFTFGTWVDGCEDAWELNETNNKLSRTFQVAQPDLIVESILPNIANPAAEQSIYMTVTVRNNSSAAAGPFQLLIDWDRTSTPGMDCLAQIPPEPFTGLAAYERSSRTFQVTYATGGAHTFWARVDGCTQVSESNENNNRSSRTMQVAAPDLVVESISPMPSFVLINRTHNVTARIRNNGTVWSNPTVAQLFLNRASAPTAQCSGDREALVDRIAPNGGFTDVSFEVSYSTTGTKQLWIWADPCRTIGEMNENNNTLSATLPVRRGADLVIDSITPTESPVRMLNSTSVDVVIRNAGDVATPTGRSINVKAILNSSETPSNMCASFDRSASTTTTAALGPGASRTVRITNVTYALPGNHTFWAKVDPCDQITESSGTNNSRSRIIDVHMPI